MTCTTRRTPQLSTRVAVSVAAVVGVVSCALVWRRHRHTPVTPPPTNVRELHSLSELPTVSSTVAVAPAVAVPVAAPVVVGSAAAEEGGTSPLEAGDPPRPATPDWWDHSRQSVAQSAPQPVAVAQQSKGVRWHRFGMNAAFTTLFLLFIAPVVGIGYWLFTNQRVEHISSAELVAWVVAAGVSITFALVCADRWQQQLLKLELSSRSGERSGEFVWVGEFFGQR